jgi:hypothetical protein
VQGVVCCPGLVFVTQAARTIYDLRGAKHEDVNHRGEPSQGADSRQLAQQGLHRQSLRGTHPRSPSPRDGCRRGQRLSANATAYPVARCGDKMTAPANSRCHHRMRVGWLATRTAACICSTPMPERAWVLIERLRSLRPLSLQKHGMLDPRFSQRCP